MTKNPGLRLAGEHTVARKSEFYLAMPVSAANGGQNKHTLLRNSTVSQPERREVAPESEPGNARNVCTRRSNTKSK